MRKIKELEERIESLETTIVEIKQKELHNQETRRNRHIAVLDRLTGIEAKQKEQEEFLGGIVVPFIAENILGVLENELQNYAKFISNTLKSLNNKNTETTPKRKVGRPRKENK